ncbi:MAG: ATP-grasp domain-containing protein [Eubacteriales bacterium]|nr:ATP-grasp domain-containing protein [Eubacteriales bacterium]
MTEVKNVLVIPAGTEIALEINNALRCSKFVKLFGATSVPCHAEFVYENCVSDIPFPESPDFAEKVNEIVERFGIDYIYPAHDSVLLALTQQQNKLKAKVVTSAKETVEITRSKNRTYEFLKGAFYLPVIYKNAEEVKTFPIFIKPAVGQGSVGAKRIDSREALTEALSDGVEYAICEYLPGDEFTVDCFTDKNGVLRFISPRSRARIRAGISVRSEKKVCDDGIRAIAEDINSRFSFTGAWFFQVKRNARGEYRLLEIAPRIAGTMSVTRNLGVNMPMLTLFTLWGYDVDIIDNGNEILLDRAFISRFKTDIEYSNVYVDFDDTMVIRGEVNGFLMMFLYQAHDKGKKLYLLTKHAKDIYESLEKYAISAKLFEKIIHIPPDGEKYEYIRPDSIFIDDSFGERVKIHKKCGIPVFDMDMAESLIDWRV